MKKRQIYRHGDMIIFKIDDINETNEKTGNKLVVGLGEVTGHSHDVFALKDSKIKTYTNSEVEVTEDDIANMDKLFFEVTGEGAVITHEEHDPHLLKPGKYLRINQTQFNPFTEQLEKVRD